MFGTFLEVHQEKEKFERKKDGREKDGSAAAASGPSSWNDVFMERVREKYEL